MYTVVVNTVIREERLAEFIEGILANAESSLRDEPGCLRFDVHQSLEDPTLFLFHEIYTSRDAFEYAHRQSAHYREFRRVVDACVIAERHVNTYFTPLLQATSQDELRGKT
jgi:autoinducer 2-degrading protein